MAKPKKTRKAKTNPSIVKRGVGAAKQGAKKAANASAVIKKKTAKNTKSVLGIGAAPKRTRAATQGDLLRKGKSLLRGGSAALARFIAARYSPKAIAKYQDYAGRLRRSKRLIKQIVKIDDATYRIKRYIIKTDTAGNNPYSCTCPDFSQFSSDARNWLGSKAGPFNPCKHMMAVRDRDKGDKWKCVSGICSLDPTGTFNTEEECLATTMNNWVGGQCPAPYDMNAGGSYLIPGNTLPTGVTWYPSIDTGGNVIYGTTGPIRYIRLIKVLKNDIFPFPPFEVFAFLIDPGVTAVLFCVNPNPSSSPIPARTARAVIGGIYVTRKDGFPDNCGNPTKYCDADSVLGCMDNTALNYDPTAILPDNSCIPVVLGCTDPAANNYNPAANTDDGSCTYGVYGCTDSDATNYDPAATIDDGSCTY